MGSAELEVAIEQCSLGLVLVAGGEAGVRAVLLGEDEAALRADLCRRFPAVVLADASDSFRARAVAVAACIEQPDARPEVLLDLRGTSFQTAVWEALSRIPAGSTVSYRELAERVGRPQAVRAVGQAVAANPIAVLIPCHRAIRSDGTLSGYRWGVERKRQLLEGEAP